MRRNNTIRVGHIRPLRHISMLQNAPDIFLNFQKMPRAKNLKDLFVMTFVWT